MQRWLEQLVFARAEGRCEYCQRPAWSSSVTFAIDHVRPVQHGGATAADNLALACPSCNLKKGPNLSAVDPLSDEQVPLFNPRRDRWREHFAWTATTIVGRSPVGRATVWLLDLNSAARRRLRSKLPPALM